MVKFLNDLQGIHFFSLAALVAKKWELEADNIKVIKLVECLSCELDDEIIFIEPSRYKFNYYITTDFATSEKTSADYSVISVWG